MQKVRILGIAPYEGMRSLMNQVAEKREDIDLTVFVGNLESGVEIANKYTLADADVILSRGGTAELIERQTALPVVDIPLSQHDILRSIKLAENYNSKYAIIGFPAITKNAQYICDILRLSIDIYTIHTQEEAEETLRRLAGSGCHMVLCDVITNSLAQRYGISSILITSGAESVESAIDQAVKTSRTYGKMTNQIRFFKAVLEEQSKEVFVYTDRGKLVYSSAMQPPDEQVVKKMEKSIHLVLTEEQKRIYFEISGITHVLVGSKNTINSELFVIFSLHSRKSPLVLSKNGVLYTSKEDAYDQFFNSFYGMMQSTFLTGMTVEQYAQSSQPLLIAGEVGTGKEQMAHLLYAKGMCSNNPFVTIDCARLHDRGWTFLLDNDNSPFFDQGTTIHIKNIKQLSDSKYVEFFTVVKDMGVHLRNRLLLTYSYVESDGLEERCQHLINTFSGLTVFMPTLRSHQNDIPNLASLYISILNMRMAKEVIGFEPDALEKLKAYHWPYNFDQFKRVLHDLMTITSLSYIKAGDVDKLLRQEERIFYKSQHMTDSELDLRRPLDEIVADIVRIVMAEENGNQTAAAKRLGIGRSTLWRMLQDRG